MRDGELRLSIRWAGLDESQRDRQEENADHPKSKEFPHTPDASRVHVDVGSGLHLSSDRLVFTPSS
jgi:hypothetical protein